MYTVKEVERKGKVIIRNGLQAQVDDSGLLVVIENGNNIKFTADGMSVILLGTEGIICRCVDKDGNARHPKADVVTRIGTRGKKFNYTERLRLEFYYDGKPVITTKYGAVVQVDQDGIPYHPEALSKTQHISQDGEYVVIDENGFVQQELGDIRLPVSINAGVISLNLCFQVDRISFADLDGRALLFDQSAIEIDGARVVKYDKLIAAVINKTLPLKQCIEASYAYDDLMNRGREVAIKSLIQVDYDKAINTVSKNKSRKKISDEERIKYKLENPEKAFAECEENWVQQALFNEFRRLAWKNSEKEKGGRGVSLNAMLAKNSSQIDENGASVSIFDMMKESEEGLFDDDSEFGLDSDTSNEVFEFDNMEQLLGSDEFCDNNLMNLEQANRDKDEMIAISEEKGEDELHAALRRLPTHRYEDLQTLLRMNIASNDRSKKTFDSLIVEFEEAIEQAQEEETVEIPTKKALKA